MYLHKFCDHITREDAIWGFFGPRAHDFLGPSAFLPFAFISCCDWGQDTSRLEQRAKIFSIEKIERQRRNWTNRDLDAGLKAGAQEDLHALLTGSRRAVNCLTYRSFENLEALARRHPHIRILSNPVSLKNKLDDKVLFRKILPRLGIPSLRGKSLRLDAIRFNEAVSQYGKPFVIQFPFGSAGSFTFIVRKETELEELKQDHPSLTVNLISYLDRACLNINAAIIEGAKGPEVVSSPPSLQLIGLKEASSGGLTFCGNDFSAVSRIPAPRLIETQALTRRIGAWMATQGFRGLFGLDLLVDDERVYPIEINPRFQNSTALLTPLSLARKDIPLAACHTAAFLANAPIPTRKETSDQHERNFEPLKGSQMILHNRHRLPVRVAGPLRPGIYNTSNGNLFYSRPGISFKNIKDTDEYLITCGVPETGKRVLPGAPILKIMTRTSVLGPDLKQLSQESRKIVELIYKSLRLEPEYALSYVA